MVKMRDKVKVVPNEKLTDMQSVISIHDGSEEIKNTHDLSNKIEKNILETKIVGKSVSLLSQSKSEQISKMLDEPEILEETEEKTESLFDYEVEEKEEKDNNQAKSSNS